MKKALSIFSVAYAQVINCAVQERGHVDASLLYCWTAEADLAYALKTKGHKSQVLNPEFQADLGFKVGFGATLPHPTWDIGMQLTHLHTRARVHKNGGHLSPLWSLTASDPAGFVQKVEGHWRLHFALIDLTLGNTSQMGKTLSLRPFFGLRYAVVRQKYLLHYQGGSLLPEAENYMSMKNKFLAPGLLTGVESNWKLGASWSLYSHFGLSIQQGSVHVHERESVSTEEEKRANIYDNFKMTKPIFDLAAGIRWQTASFNHRYRLTFQLGWEQYLLFAQNQFFHFTSAGNKPFANNQELLAIQGLALSSAFHY